MDTLWDTRARATRKRPAASTTTTTRLTSARHQPAVSVQLPKKDNSRTPRWPAEPWQGRGVPRRAWSKQHPKEASQVMDRPQGMQAEPEAEPLQQRVPPGPQILRDLQFAHTTTPAKFFFLPPSEASAVSHSLSSLPACWTASSSIMRCGSCQMKRPSCSFSRRSESGWG